MDLTLGQARSNLRAITVAFQKHARVQMEGRLTSALGGVEVWSCGINVHTGAAAGYWLANPKTYVDSIADALKAWFQNINNLISSAATLDVVKCNNINPDGTYADPTTNQHVYTPAGVGGAGSQTAPAFCSVVTTWETGAGRGHASRGRIYLPNFVLPVQGSYINPSGVDGVNLAGKALLNVLLQNEPTGGLLVRPCVVSKIGSAINDITGVSCDNIFDYQSRRKNRLKSVRNTIAFP